MWVWLLFFPHNQPFFFAWAMVHPSLFFLGHPSVTGRLPSSSACLRAAVFVAETMKWAGVEATGDIPVRRSAHSTGP